MGADRLDVVLLSVDPSYFPNSDDYVARARGILADHKVEWTSVFLPGGWDGAQRTFNASGYGKIVVDARGIVRGANLHAQELDRLVRKVVAEAEKAEK